MLAFGFATLVDAAGFTLVQVSIFFLFKYRFVYWRLVLYIFVFDFVLILRSEKLYTLWSFFCFGFFCALPSLFCCFNSWNFKMKGEKGWRWLTCSVGNGNLALVMREKRELGANEKNKEKKEKKKKESAKEQKVQPESSLMFFRKVQLSCDSNTELSNQGKGCYFIL